MALNINGKGFEIKSQLFLAICHPFQGDFKVPLQPSVSNLEVILYYCVMISVVSSELEVLVYLHGIALQVLLLTFAVLVEIPFKEMSLICHAN